MAETALERLETILTHQERQIQDLSDMLVIQGRDIEILKKRLDRALLKLAAVEGSGALDGAGDKALSPTEQAARDKPPHY